ncbi:luciferase-like monooxygenase family protein [Rhodococcus sp. MTM3W5.2]|nr:luciferase-like monooxygenase family protein [Rhodococcus sp. MTM3W5.2]
MGQLGGRRSRAGPGYRGVRRSGQGARDRPRWRALPDPWPAELAALTAGPPLLVQAGSSESGKEFAARHAEAVFTAQRTLAQGRSSIGT